MRLGTPIVNVIWENSQFGSIVWKQDKKFGTHFGVDFTNPDFVKLGESFGLPPGAASRSRTSRGTCARAVPGPAVARSCCRSTTRSTWPSLRNSATETVVRHEHRNSQPQEQSSSTASRLSSTSAASGATRPAAARCRSRIPRPARRSPRSPTPRSTDASAALDAAVAAQAECAATPPRERSEILRRAYEADRRAADDLALAHDDGDGQVRRGVQGRDPLRRGVLPLVRRARRVRIDGPLQGSAPTGTGRVHRHAASRSGPACSSRRGTSRWRWARARSVRPSRRAARWSSSPPSRRRCRCSRSRRSSRRPACPAAS